MKHAHCIVLMTVLVTGGCETEAHKEAVETSIFREDHVFESWIGLSSGQLFPVSPLEINSCRFSHARLYFRFRGFRGAWNRRS
jgi:hypothetical protein